MARPARSDMRWRNPWRRARRRLLGWNVRFTARLPGEQHPGAGRCVGFGGPAVRAHPETGCPAVLRRNRRTIVVGAVHRPTRAATGAERARRDPSAACLAARGRSSAGTVEEASTGSGNRLLRRPFPRTAGGRRATGERRPGVRTVRAERRPIHLALSPKVRKTGLNCRYASDRGTFRTRAVPVLGSRLHPRAVATTARSPAQLRVEDPIDTSMLVASFSTGVDRTVEECRERKA